MSQYDQYREQAVLTMTREELLLVLFDELIKRLNRCKLTCDGSNDEVFEASLQRSVDIIKYLRQSLNRQYNISTELASLYEFFTFELMRLKASRKVEIIEGVVTMVKELRDTFAEAGKKQNG